MRELKIHACEDAHISVPMAELKDICMYEPSYTSAHTQTRVKPALKHVPVKHNRAEK